MLSNRFFDLRIWIFAMLFGANSFAAYHFTPGSTVVYSIVIVGELPQSTETISGHLFYDVKSFDADSKQASISFSGSLNAATKRSAPPSPLAPEPIFTLVPMIFPTQITLNEKGKVVRSTNSDQLSFVLGNAWQLPLEQAPPAGREQWSVDRSVDIKSRIRTFAVPAGFGDASQSAEETSEYKAAAGSSSGIVFDKTYSLVTDETLHGQPILSETGKGQIAFDTSTGWLKSMNMHFQLVYNREHITMTIPVALEVKMLDADEVRQAVAAKRAAAEAATKANAERERPKLLDNSAIDMALLKLRSVDSFRIQEGCEALEHAIVVKARQSEVISALVPLLKDSDNFVHTEAAKALGVWGDSKTVPALESALNSDDVFLQQSAIEALGHFPSQTVADDVAKQLPDMSVRTEVENALIKMGSVAEPSVLPLLKNVQWDVRLSACKILAAIGTQQSIPPLENLSGAEHNSLVIINADRAVDAIRSRTR